MCHAGKGLASLLKITNHNINQRPEAYRADEYWHGDQFKDGHVSRGVGLFVAVDLAHLHSPAWHGHRCYRRDGTAFRLILTVLAVATDPAGLEVRSEERRVGKEV